MNNNGVMKHLIRLRKMINLAIRLEWIVKDSFKNYKFKYEKIDKDFLTLLKFLLDCCLVALG